jgi:hypothetical protein
MIDAGFHSIRDVRVPVVLMSNGATDFCSTVKGTEV